MSAWLFESSPYDDGIVATIWADTDADLPGVNDFGEPLKEMSICKIISNGRKYILDSTGTWKIQPISDLSQYGTRSWIIELLEQSTLGTAHQPNETLKSLNFHEDLGQEGVLLLDVFQPIQIDESQVTNLTTDLSTMRTEIDEKYSLGYIKSLNTADLLTVAYGKWKGHSGVTYQNAPSGISDNFIFIVDYYVPDPSRKYLTLIDLDGSTTIYHRYQASDGTWGSWYTDDAFNSSSYYTAAQVDAAITSAINTALASYTTTADMNTAINTAIMTTQYTNRGTEPADNTDILNLPVGRYFKSSNAQTLVNIPSTFTGAACVFEIRNTTTTTGTRMRIDFWSCSPNNEPHYWFAVKASTPAEWKPWIEMTGTVLT